MIYQSDGVRIDTAAFRVERDGTVCDLEPKAFDLLVYLVRQHGRVVTKAQILEDVWTGVAVTDNALTRVIAQLRRALGDGARESRFIETVPTRGYRWLPPVLEDNAAGGAASADAERGSSAVRGEVVIRPGGVAPASRRARGAAVVAVALLLVAATWWWSGRSPASSSVQFTTAMAVQITTERGLDLFPNVSPDRTSLFYSSDRSGSFELYVRSLVRGGAETQVTHDGGQNVQPACSPDGRRVAFHSMVRGGIWVMPALGGAARQLATFGSDPAWSPDGRLLAFQSDPLGDIGPAALGARSGSTIWVVAADGNTAPHAITRPNQPPGGHAAPVWTPDGARIVFINHAISASEIWSVRADGRESTQLLAPDKILFEPAYSTDGKRTFVATGGSILWTSPVDPISYAATGPRTAVSMSAVDGVRSPAPAPDGRVLFSGLTLESELVLLPMDPAGDGPAGPPRAITNSSARRTTAPVISPDGQWVAYVSGARGAAADIWVRPIAGGAAQPVTTAPEPDRRPTWFPDSDALSFVSTRDGVAGIWKTSRTTGRESLLIAWPPPAGAGHSKSALRTDSQEPRMSPDGSRVSYSAINSATGREELHVLAFATGEDRVIVSGDESASYPCWSPDGRLIAFEARHVGGTQIGVVPAAGGTVRIITSAAGEHWVHSFSPDGSKVLSADLENGVWNVAWTSVADGRRRVLTSYTTPRTFVRYPAWSPKGNAIVFEEARLNSNIWSSDVPVR